MNMHPRFDRDYRAYAAEDFIAGARFADKKSDEYAEEYAKAAINFYTKNYDEIEDPDRVWNDFKESLKK